MNLFISFQVCLVSNLPHTSLEKDWRNEARADNHQQEREQEALKTKIERN